MADPKTARTVETLENGLSSASDVHAASGSNDIHAMVADRDIGGFYGAVRREGLDAEMFRDGDIIRGFVNFPDE